MATAPGTAVSVSVYGVVAAQPSCWSGCRVGSISGNTQPQSSSVSTVGRASAEPVPVELDWLRKPQPPPRLSVMKGTTTLCVTSMTESTLPAAPQYTLKSAARTAPASTDSTRR